jgi:hypothetical protein
MKRACFCAGIYWLFLVWGCSPSQDSLRRGIERLAASDLKKIVMNLEQRGVDSVISETPHFEVAEFIVFRGDSARVYRAFAEVNFYYLKALKLYQVRKYRYNSSIRVWECYDIKLKHLYTKTKEKSIRAKDSLHSESE